MLARINALIKQGEALERRSWGAGGGGGRDRQTDRNRERGIERG